MKKNILAVLIILLMIVALIAAVKFFSPKTQQTQVTQQTEKYWTCGMHPSVRVSDAEYKKGKVNCPICNMPLIPAQTPHPGPLPRGERELSGPFPKGEREYNFSLSPEGGEGRGEGGQEVQEAHYGCGVKEEGHCPHCDEGKPDADCICGGHSFLIKTDKHMNCPVCGKPLKKLEGETGEKGIAEEVVSRVNISRREAELAGVAVEPVKRHHLTKLIRTVGKIAFHPELSVAQEEFLTALETRQKVADSTDPDVIRRADDLVEKSRFKLRLLGMGNDEIAELEKEGKAQLSLVLPEDKAWVYADVYEYELGWVKSGQEALITATAYPGEEFKGAIKHISPVLNPMTRSATVRIEVGNLAQKLKPEMYVDVIVKTVYVDQDGESLVLAIPKNAVLDTGTRKIVYVEAERGVYLGKEVQIGPAAAVSIGGMEQQLYPVIKGLKEGDRVVTKANFLLDSQSQISPAVAGAYGGALDAKEETKPPAHQH